ncbi:hypothetical protein N7495_003056 [Penicillium taxi]|uniref:uncharacterized protein n=1 Tax=Penicillium taxi TaxID=168475 RepID=UPI0025452FF4|nr:uncharacterized protein N7495_003056 [Penicillium taxi]KAJ5902528.1 hypothetical protein N7495_003056 [Penicillium taxi]
MSSSAHFPNPENFELQSRDLISWLHVCPGVRINPKINLADLRSKGAGRGLVAGANIAEGEELFSIPRSIILSVENSGLKSLLLQNELEALGPWLSLMLVMIYEYSQDAASNWKLYLSMMPNRFDTLMFWSPDELRELQASAIVDKIGKQSADESILQKILPIVRANPQLFPAIKGPADYAGDAGAVALLQLAHGMGSLIMAYAFDIEKVEDDEGDDEGENEDENYETDDEDEQLPKGMVPLADLLNADADRNNARLYQEGDSFVMKAIKHVQQGEEIFNDYGEIPRADLLRRYGYVTDNYAQFDVIELSIRDVCQVAGLQDDHGQPRLDLLEKHDVLEDGYVIPRPLANATLENIIPAELVLLLTVLTQTPEDFEERRAKNKLPKRVALDVNQAGLLYKVLQVKQAQYGTSIAHDIHLLSGLLPPNAPEALEGTPRRLKMALQVRIGEKEVLQAIMSMLEPLIGNSSKRANDDSEDSRPSKTSRA